MTPAIGRALRIITWALIVIAAALWLFTIVGWFVTNPGFEPANVFMSVAVSTLAGILAWLGRSSRDTTSQVKFSIISSSASLSDGGIEAAQGQFSLNPELTIECYARICTHNPGLPASVKIVVASLAPDFLNTCLSSQLRPETLSVAVRFRENPNWASVDLGNPFSIPSGDRNTEVSVKIPLVVKEIENNSHALALLQSMVVVFRADFQATRRQVMLDPVHLDLVPVHRSIEDNVIAKIPKYHIQSTQAIDTKQLVQALKRYWLGKD